MGKVYDILSGNETFDYAPLPNKSFKIVYADPNWRFKTYSEKGKGRSADKHYKTSNVDELATLPVEQIADKDCILFLWVSNPMLIDAINLAHTWGFQYKTVAFTWVKQNKNTSGYFKGMGYWTRKNPEMCLLFTKGKPKRVSMNVEQLIISPRREHSRKPDEIKDRIVELMGDVPRIELFARHSPDDGWDYWGNESTKFNDEELEIEVELE